MKLPKLSVASPETPLGERMLTLSPVVLTVLATLLTGLAASEMTKAQYYRATAAQNQAKAGDQWGFFQAKKLRGAGDRNTAELLQALGDTAPFDPAAAVVSAHALSDALGHIDAQARQALAALGDPLPAKTPELLWAQDYLVGPGSDQRRAQAGQAAAELATVVGDPESVQGVASLRDGKMPALADWAPADPKVGAALAAIQAGQDEAETKTLMAQVRATALTEALRAAQDRVRSWDEQAKPMARTIDRVQGVIDRYGEFGPLTVRAAWAIPTGGQGQRDTMSLDTFTKDLQSLRKSFAAARLRLEAARYDAEARMNQTIAGLYEIQVRKSSFDSERHKTRSQHFFFGALAAQAAVIGATFALAVKRRSMLWGLATSVGLAAFGFGAYVYLFV
jgi:hypothetical protein